MMLRRKALLLLICGLCCLLAAPAPIAFAHQIKRPVPLSGEVERAAGYEEVVDALRAWNPQAARKKIEFLRRESPGLAEWDALLGAADYYAGKFPEAIARLNAALEKKPGDSEWLELRLHVRQTQAAVKGFEVHKTAHFDIWHAPGQDAALMPYLGDALEKAYVRYGRELGVRPEQRIRVEFFSDSERLHKSATLSRRDIEEKGAVGVCKFNKLMILSPGSLLRGYRWLDTAAHEYLHYLIVLATKNRAPIWLHEGIAKHMEKKWRGGKSPPYLHPVEEAVLHQAREANNYIPFKKMEPSIIYLETQRDIQLAYAQAASAVDFIRRKMGKRALVRLLRAIRDAPAEELTRAVPIGPVPKEPPPEWAGGAARYERRASLVEIEATGPPQSAEPGLRAVAKVDLGGFEKLWIADLKKRPLAIRPGARVSLPKLRSEGPMDERSMDLGELKSAVARKRMRLGDRFSFRGRMRAALAQYERALRDEPYSQPLLNRVAQVALDLGMISQARRHIRRALEVDPDYAMTYVHQAMVNEKDKKWKRATWSWEEVIQINPLIRLAHERLAALYAKTGQAEKAKRARERLRLMAPG